MYDGPGLCAQQGVTHRDVKLENIFVKSSD